MDHMSEYLEQFLIWYHLIQAKTSPSRISTRKIPPKKARAADEALELVTGHGVGVVLALVVGVFDVVVVVVPFVVVGVVVVVPLVVVVVDVFVVPFAVVDVVVVVPFVVVEVIVVVFPFVVVVVDNVVVPFVAAVVVLVVIVIVVEGDVVVELVSFSADAEAKKNKTRSTLIAGMVTTWAHI